MIELRVNGELRSVAAEPATPLLYVLRNDLGLTAAKPGCGLSQCGSCTVLIDGEARRSCALPVGSVASAEITTLEGLGTAEAPHPLQRAFVAENAAQCGYCTSGILLAAKALLDRNPQPDAREIKRALAENLCRCGAHNRVLRAVQRAARELAGRT
ncbi:MAG TPA: (2Fe-2S)-binding protein [Polyangiales bacterium]|nr:(2Fe-2S)-binding protein [Polyangiales bacterium]